MLRVYDDLMHHQRLLRVCISAAAFAVLLTNCIKRYGSEQ